MKMTGENLRREAQKISLNPEERVLMRELVATFIKEHPIAGQPQRKSPEKTGKVRVISGYYSKWYYTIRQSAAAAAVIILVGAGTSFAAEGSLPGDLLYPVKIKVNENVVGAVRLGDKGNGNFEAWVTERRLGEVTALASNGSLSPETRSDLELRLETSLKNVHDKVTKLSENDDLESAAELSERLETTLEAHSKILERISEARQDNRSEIYPIASKIKLEAENIARVSALTDDVAVSAVGENIKALVEKRFHEAGESLRKTEEAFSRVVSDDNSAKSAMEASSSLRTAIPTTDNFASAKSRLSEGRARFDEGDFRGASEIFHQIKKAADEIKKVEDIKKKYSLKIDVDWDQFAEIEDDDKSAIMMTANASSSESVSPASRVMELDELIPKNRGEQGSTTSKATSTKQETESDKDKKDEKTRLKTKIEID